MVNAKDWINKGNELFDKGKFNEAIQTYQRALNLKSNDIDLLINIGLSYRHLEDYDKAIEYYDKVLEIDPDNKTVINNIGYTLECKGEIDEAIVNYKKSLDIDPAYDIPLVNLSNIYFDKKEYDKVIVIFERALKIDSLNVANWIDLGRAYRYLEKFDEAIDSYLKALKLDKNDKIALNNLGFVYFCQKQYDKAIDAYTRSLEIDWLYDLPFSNLIKIYKKMIKEKSNDYITWKDVANGFFVARAYKRGIDACNRSLDINPDFNDTITLNKKILEAKTKFDMNPLLLKKIEEALELFSSISISACLNDIIEYVKYKSPELIFKELELKDLEIKFKIFEMIREKEINAKLDKDKLIFYQKPIDNTKIDYLK
jgi:tetratricopeptide (TPR) repeat protein